MGPRPLPCRCATHKIRPHVNYTCHTPQFAPFLLSFSPSSVVVVNVLLLQLLLFFSLPSLVSPLHSNIFPLPSAISLLSSPFFPLPFSLSLVSFFPSPFSPAQPSILSANCYEFFLTLPLSLSLPASLSFSFSFSFSASGLACLEQFQLLSVENGKLRTLCQ